MRIKDVGRSAWSDDHRGFAFVIGMCIFWLGPLMFGAMAVMGPRVIWPMLAGAVITGVGWVLAWVVMIRQVRRSPPGASVDLTPTVPLVAPAVLMVGGVLLSLLSF
ncbi:hypothetical protein [Janibacter sp. LM]|uniref:hypothetical protein n=1 Tax=Janibacter TaxID=53457 RepID=UPI0031F5F5D3|nr:hypothetical protein [Kytococcus sp.]